MSRRPLLAAAGYTALAAADTYLASRGTTKSRRMRILTKPLLMPALAVATATATTTTDGGGATTLRNATLTAQAFSWGGDVALMGKSETSFLAGVGSFFAGHVAYIAGFTSARGRLSDSNLTGAKAAAGFWMAAAPGMAYAAGRKDPKLRGPIAAYSAILSTMFATSTLLDSDLPRKARGQLLAGTSLFLASDTILGLREFILPGDSAKLDAAVMATYTAGQGLIAAGTVAAVNA
jgi:uncharacterized membrane protein YhhN